MYLLYVREVICHLQREVCGMNFFESLKHVTVSFKEGSTFHHLIHVTSFKFRMIIEADELYVHYTLERSNCCFFFFTQKCQYVKDRKGWRTDCAYSSVRSQKQRTRCSKSFFGTGMTRLNTHD